jgi:hypothetical protein
MSGIWLKVRRLLNHYQAIRACGGLSQSEPVSGIECIGEHSQMPVAIQLIPARFDKKQSRSHPAKPVIAALPSFDLRTDPAHHRETGFDRVGTGQRLAKPGRKAKVDDGQSFIESFCQTGSGARFSFLPVYNAHSSGR